MRQYGRGAFGRNSEGSQRYTGGISEKLNVSVTTVRSWEQEKSSPSHDALVAICRLYRISADYLLGLSEVDPAYDPRGNQQRFTDDEWAALREYEEFLLWKRRKKAKQ